MSRWTEDVTIRFVAEYLRHDALWNVKSPLYKSKQAKQTAYSAIEEHMKLPGFGEKEIKTKIKNIRSTYSQEVKKIKDSEMSGAGTEVYVPNVKWFTLLHASLQSVSSEMQQIHSSMDDADNMNPYEARREEEEAVRMILSETTLADVDTKSLIKIPPTHKAKRARVVQQRSIEDDLKGLSDAVNTSQIENEFEVFGRNVGLQLNTMPLMVALEAQQYIQTYLNKTRLTVMANQNRSLQPPENASLLSLNSGGNIRISEIKMSPTGTEDTKSTFNFDVDEAEHDDVPESHSESVYNQNVQNVPKKRFLETEVDVFVNKKPRKVKEIPNTSNDELISKACDALCKASANDECDYLGYIAATKLRKMSDDQRLYCEMLINSALYKGALGRLTEHSTIKDD